MQGLTKYQNSNHSTSTQCAQTKTKVYIRNILNIITMNLNDLS